MVRRLHTVFKHFFLNRQNYYIPKRKTLSTLSIRIPDMLSLRRMHKNIGFPIVYRHLPQKYYPASLCILLTDHSKLNFPPNVYWDVNFMTKDITGREIVNAPNTMNSVEKHFPYIVEGKISP